MLTVLLSFTIILLCIAGLSVAALLGGKPIGTCCRKPGGHGSDSRACSLCGKHLER